MTAVPVTLDFAPGIQRDGTKFDAKRCLDALWCRWRLNRPRKIGGFQSISQMLSGIPRRIHMFYQGSLVYIHVGTSKGIQQIITDRYGNVHGIYDRTPNSFAGGIDVGWTLDALFDTTSTIVQLVAHAVPDLDILANNAKSVPLIGQIDSSTVLSKFVSPGGSIGGGSYVQPNVTGGIVCVQPYVFDFSDAGFIGWSAPNQPMYLGVFGGSSGAGQARVSAQKIVAGTALRGGGAQSPAALFWSLSEVITATFVGSSAGIFAFNTISPSSSIMSSDCVVEYDSIYYWIGVDRFMMFNGTVSEVRNDQNQDWFFDNINRAFAAKCFAFKMPRYGEIWFCAPLFGATEPSHACILNVREGYWYDTMLPNGGRSAGYFAQGLPFPVLGGVVPGGAGYTLWMHETGVDQMVGGVPTAVRSYFETPWIGGPKDDPPANQGLSVEMLEPDILQTGDMSVYIIGQANNRAPSNVTSSQPIKAIATVPQEQMTGFRQSQRIQRLHFESNVVGGNYICGRNLVHVDKSDGRITS